MKINKSIISGFWNEYKIYINVLIVMIRIFNLVIQLHMVESKIDVILIGINREIYIVYVEIEMM